MDNTKETEIFIKEEFNFDKEASRDFDKVNTDLIENEYLRTQEPSVEEKRVTIDTNHVDIFAPLTTEEKEEGGMRRINTDAQSTFDEEEAKQLVKIQERKLREEKEKKKNVLKGVIQMRKINKQIADNLLENKAKSINQDKLIMELEEEIKFIRGENAIATGNYSEVNKVKQSAIYNNGKISDYCNGLRKKFKGAVETIDFYEATISELKLDNAKQIKGFDESIRMIEKESKTIAEEMDYSEKKIDYQKEQISDYKVKLKQSIEQYNKQNGEFISREKDFKKKFDQLMKKYDELQLISENFMLKDRKKVTSISKNQNFHSTNHVMKQNLDVKLHEYIQENEFLKNQIKELNRRVLMQASEAQNAAYGTVQKQQYMAQKGGNRVIKDDHYKTENASKQINDLAKSQTLRYSKTSKTFR